MRVYGLGDCLYRRDISPIRRRMALLCAIATFLFTLIASTSAEIKQGPSLDVTAEVEMSSARVRRDSDPERELLLILITIKPSSSELQALTLFVVENDAVESVVPSVKGVGRIVLKDDVLAVLTESDTGWCFVPRRLNDGGACTSPKLQRMSVSRIGRYYVLKGTATHQEIATQVFSGKRDNQLNDK
jgi:hypothetical protein